MIMAYKIDLPLNRDWEILTEHDKGKDYAHLIEDFDKYPLILDKDDNVLSMPPIINGELTKIKEDTHNIIVDVTGTDEKAVNQSLNIICSSFAEIGGQIKSMEVKYEDKTIVTPDLTPQEMNVHVDTANELIGGINLTAEDIKELLLKTRFDAEIISENEVKAIIPSYRVDILHEVDIVENIAIERAKELFGEKITKLGGDCSYSGNDNRTFCSDENIVTSFVQKGKKREASASVSLVRKELARVRATAMEGSFGTQKEHYGLKRINGRIKKTEILIIFFGIHTANTVQLARRIAKAELSQAA